MNVWRNFLLSAYLPILFFCVLTVACQTPVSPEEKIDRNVDFAPLIDTLTQFIQEEITDKEVPALSIVLVHGNETVWSSGFGYNDSKKSTPATANTIYRVGSVSKLFTDIGIMQMVEQGVVDLDIPVKHYLPDFTPANPFGLAITLRQLMAHRSGLVREPPVGHYFDDSAPSLASTVASLNRTELVYPPGERIKYSNAGIAVVGRVLEELGQKPFAEYLEENVLQPLGMENSAFYLQEELENGLPEAYMWAYDGRRFRAPVFELGMAPAGNMYSSVADLGRFMQMLLEKGKTTAGYLLKPETLQQMWTPQFAAPNTDSGFGIGFSIAKFKGKRLIGHGGAVYGFSTQLYVLPEENLGVAVVAALDGTNAVVDRIAKLALDGAMATKEAEPLPLPFQLEPVEPALAKKLDGKYISEKGSIQLKERNGKLYLWTSTTKTALKAIGDTLITDDRLAFGTRLVPIGADQIRMGPDTYTKQKPSLPPEINPEWKSFVGEYGWDYNTLFILEKDEQLHALIEWFFQYPLTPVAPDTFAFPDYGLYHGEKVVFTRNKAGRITAAVAAGISFPFRASAFSDVTFKIEPIRTMQELKRRAFEGTPPEEEAKLEPNLVEITSLDPSIPLDIRYAGKNNFMGAIFYDEPKAFLQRPAAEALVKVHRRLKERGLGLMIHDAYRPWYVTKMFWDATPGYQKHFVADPGIGSIHNRGAAVDLTLFNQETNKAVLMPSGFDEFSARAYPEYPAGTSRQRYYRELLRDAMEAQGFRVFRWEWWHYNYRGATRYPILNLKFDEIDR